MILYAKDETQFNHLGLGVLSEATKAIVTEERNGSYHLEFEYPVDGHMLSLIEMDSLIKADAGHKSKGQLFFVSKITKPIRGVVKIYAQHVSRQAEKNQLGANVSGNGTAEQALQAWIDNLVDKTVPWTAYSDKSFASDYSWRIEDTDNAMRALGGQRGSLLQTFRGEYEFNNWAIRLWTNRGVRVNTVIAYGRNLVDFEQEEIIVDTYTSIMPFAYDEETDELIILPEVVVDSEHVANYPTRKIFKLDLSQEEIETVDELRDAATTYIEQNNIGVPKVSIKLKHQDLSQIMGYEDAPQEEIGLCDVVPIYFEKLGIQTEAKVVAAKWNVLLERYEELTFGDTSRTLAQAVSQSVTPRLERIRDEAIRFARQSADGKNAVYQGEIEPTGGNEGDIWFKLDGSDTIMYRYEDGVWTRVIGTADEIDAGRLTTGTLDATRVNVINLDANSITSGKISSNFLQIGADTTYIDGETETTLGTEFLVLDGKIVSTVSSAVSDLQEDLEGYVSSEVDTRITNYSSEVDQRFDSITATFTEVTTDIGDLGNELQTALDTISTYIRFSIDGIELGEIGNPIKLFIENDRIVFTQNDVEVAYIDNNRLYITDGQFLNSLRLGEFAFIPRSNGNLSFGKVT